MRSKRFVVIVVMLSISYGSSGMNLKHTYPKSSSYPECSTVSNGKITNISFWHSDSAVNQSNANQINNCPIQTCSTTYDLSCLTSKEDRKAENYCSCGLSYGTKSVQQNQSKSEQKINFNPYMKLPDQYVHYLPDQEVLDKNTLKLLNEINDTFLYIMKKRSKTEEKQFRNEKSKRYSDTAEHLNRLKNQINGQKQNLGELYQALYNAEIEKVSRIIPSNEDSKKNLECRNQIRKTSTEFLSNILDYSYSCEKLNMLGNENTIPTFDIVPYELYQTTRYAINIVKTWCESEIWQDSTVIQNEIFVRHEIQSVCVKLTVAEGNLLDRKKELNNQQNSLNRLVLEKSSTINEGTIALYNKAITEKQIEIENTSSQYELASQQVQVFQKELRVLSMRLAIYSSLTGFKRDLIKQQHKK